MFFNYIKCVQAATAIEYVMIAAGVALAILAAVFAFGGDLNEIFGRFSDTTNNG